MLLTCTTCITISGWLLNISYISCFYYYYKLSTGDPHGNWNPDDTFPEFSAMNYSYVVIITISSALNIFITRFYVGKFKIGKGMIKRKTI